MCRYLSLINLTDQGIKDIGHSTDRASAFNEMVEAAGGKVVSVYWAVGEYDGAVIFEAPDEQTAASLLLKLGKEGNVRTHSLRIFEADEFTANLK